MKQRDEPRDDSVMAKKLENYEREGTTYEVVSTSLPSEPRARAPARILKDVGVRDCHGRQPPEWWRGAVGKKCQGR